MPLNDAQRVAFLGQVEAKQTVENLMQELNDLLAETMKWDSGQGSYLIPEDMTDAQVVAKACVKLNAKWDEIEAAVKARPRL